MKEVRHDRWDSCGEGGTCDTSRGATQAIYFYFLWLSGLCLYARARYLRSDKVLVGVVLWNDLAIALADYRARGSSTNTIYGNLVTFEPSIDDDDDDNNSSSIGSGSLEHKSVRPAREGEETSREGPAPFLSRSESGGGSWPKLAWVAEAVKKRVNWLPGMDTVESALLE